MLRIKLPPLPFLVVFTFAAILTGQAQVFPLPEPTRPTSFPLVRPAVTGTVVSWGDNSSGETNAQAGLTGVVAIAAGAGYSVALKSDGTVVAWGQNNHGQTTVPAGLNNVVAIAAGASHVVALKADGTVVAWGDNTYGETTIPGGLNNVVAIAAGGYGNEGDGYTVALKSDGTVVAWGSNQNRQTTIPAGLSNVIAIAAGDRAVSVIVQDGTIAGRVVSWGAGAPAVPTGLSGVVRLTTDPANGLALKSDGTVLLWDIFYQPPVGLSNVIALANGCHVGTGVLALKVDGTIVAWGDNTWGVTTTPAGLSGVTAIAMGYSHAVALVSDGLVVPNRAIATAQVVNGFVVGLDLIGGGKGYTNPPTVLIKGGGGSGATATAIVAQGMVTGFTITNPGSGYTSLPQVLIASPPFTPHATLAVSRVNVTVNVVLGLTYQIQASNDLVVWTPTGPPFVADSETITQEFIVADTGRYFRVVLASP